MTQSSSSAEQYADEKSLTKRRSRSAQHIEAYLVRQRELFRRLMSVDERRMRQVLVSWPVSPFETGYKPPLQIGSFALLAHPGTILETESEDDATRMTKTRFLIKLTDNGTIFNLVCTLNGDELSWTWKSQEFHSGMVSGETLEMLKQAVTQLVETEIPHVLAKVSPIPT